MTTSKKTVKLSSVKSAKAEKPKVEVNPEIGEFNNKPTLCLNPDSKFRFQFGLGKARMIVECIEQITAFVESEGASLE